MVEGNFARVDGIYWLVNKNLLYLWLHMANIEKWLIWSSSIGLGFLNPTSQLKSSDVTAVCMQLRTVRIGHGISKGEYMV